MKIKEAMVFAMLLLILIPFSAALGTEGTIYNSEVVIDGGGGKTNSTSYSMIAALSQTVVGRIASTMYDNYLGFFHTAVSAVTGNRAPSAPTIDLIPDSPVTTNDLICNITTNSTDADNDKLNYTYEWYRDSVLNLTILYTFNTSHTLGSANTSKRETWKCTVIPFDGTVNGTSASDSVTIQLTNVTANLTSPLDNWYVNSTVMFECSASSDIDLVNITLYHNYSGTWEINETEQVSGLSASAQRNLTLLTAKTFAWSCYGCDTEDSCSFADNRTITMDFNNPGISFVFPTPSNDTRNSTSYNYDYVNVSVSDNYNNYSAFVDWNRSLVGWWRFEDNYNDSSSYGNNGTQGTAAYQPKLTTGYRGKAYEFDGSDDYVETSNTLDFASNRTTFSAWVKIKGNGTSDAQQNMIINIKNAWDYYKFGWTMNTKKAHCVMNFDDDSYSNVDGNTALTFNVWYHLSCVYDGSNVILYLNGVQDGTSAAAKTLRAATNPATIGTLKSGATLLRYFNGTIDEVKIYNRALSPEEINASYQAKVHCYDNETEILTQEGWKYFKDITFEDNVATLNPETAETEFHQPTEIQDYAYNGEMYNIETEKGNLLVSPEHKVYSSQRLSEMSLVETPKPISNSKDSYVHTFKFLDKQSAIKSSSFSCLPSNSFALGINAAYSSNGTNIIFSNNNEASSLNSDSDNLDLASISALLFKNSSLSFKGAKRANLLSNKSLIISPCEINVLNSTLASRTASIYNNPLCFNFLCIEDLTLLANSSASFFENFDLETIFLNFSNDSASFSCFKNSSLANADQFTQRNLDISDFNLGSAANVIDAIYITPLAFSSSNFFSSSILSDITFRATAATFTSGNSFLNLFKSSSGTDMVTFGILSTSNNYVNASNYVKIYKPFSLQPIKQVYDNFDNKDVYFLDEKNNPIKVSSIKKENYSGRIYDVTVDNHIILVRRRNSPSTLNSQSEFMASNSNSSILPTSAQLGEKNAINLLRRFNVGPTLEMDAESAEPKYLVTWSGNSLYRNFTSLSSGTYTYKAYAVDQAGNLNETEERTFKVNYKPTQGTPIINSSSGTNTTLENLSCFNTSTVDLDSDFVVNSYAWYKNGILNATMPRKSDNGLVLYMPFNKNHSSDNITRDYALSNDGLVTQNQSNNGVPPAWTSLGKVGGAYEFDGVDDFINVNNDNNLEPGTGDFSLEYWIKRTDTTDRIILAKSSTSTGVAWMIRYSATMFYFDGTHRIDTTYTLPVDTDWHHVVSTLDRSTSPDTGKVYVDGILNSGADQDTLDGEDISNLHTFTIGKGDFGWFGGKFFDGTIDEVAIYNRALSASEIRQQYRLGKYFHPDGYSQINSSETSKGEQWICQITPMDYMDEANATNSTTLTINSPPSTVNLSYPLNDSTITNRTPRFNWTQAVDPDGDTVSYQILILRESCEVIEECYTDKINVTAISTNYYIPAKELDVDAVYNWSVRANDSNGYGEWSDVWNFTVSSLNAISLPTSSVSFGSKSIGDKDNTTDDSPLPVTVQNDGNIYVNLTLYSNQSLWSTSYAPLNTSYFMFKADNSTELNSFNGTGSQTTWGNVSSYQKNLIKQLNYSDATDMAEIDTFIEVPSDEPIGTKTTYLVIQSVKS